MSDFWIIFGIIFVGVMSEIGFIWNAIKHKDDWYINFKDEVKAYFKEEREAKNE